MLYFPAAALDTIPRATINSEIKRIVNGVKPDVLFIPFWGDRHIDHQIVSDACLIATRLSRAKILAYETLSETEWGTIPFTPNVYVDIYDTIDAKLSAMKAYKSELKEFPHPRSLEIIKAHAMMRGSEVGLKFAEAFMLVREIL